MTDGTRVVKSFKSEAEAHLACSRLNAEGIQAAVHRFSRYRAIASGGWLLRVHANDFARAESILKRINPEIDMDEYVSSDDDTYRRCPACRSVNVLTAPLPPRLRWLAVLGLGIPLLFIQRDRTCRKCGHKWRE